MIIILPIPDKALGPNGSRGRSMKAIHARAAKVKLHRQRAKVAMLQKLGFDKPPVFTRYRLAFFHKQRRNRDDDNASASCKAYRDGIADALKVDDNTLRMEGTPTMGIDRVNPRLEITLLP